MVDVDKLTTKVMNMHSVFKKLLDKVTLMEKRILKIENDQSKENENTLDSDFKIHKKLLEEQTINMSNTYTILEEMISTNKESLMKIEDDLKNSRESPISNEKRNLLLKKCNFFNKGFCKFKENCPFLHPTVICTELNCKEKECSQRHPKNCKNFLKGSCKFGELCEFIHHDESTQHVNIVVTNETIENFDTSTYVDYDNIDSDDDQSDEHTKTNVIDKKKESVVFSCNECDKAFHLKSILTKHVKTVHKKEKPKALKFKTHSALKRKLEGNSIISSKKTKEETFSCDECEYKTKNKESLKNHKETSHKVNQD